ncbi:MAG: Glu/Leu/Phe/Val dehydrogenase dimerization domain-containing protein [Planctomycetota bacterium]
MDMQEIPVEGYEKVVVAKDPDSGLHALIAVHDTTLGPALGGMRMWPYRSQDEALTDVLRLSKGMTFKSAIAHTGLGGGKAVIIGPKSLKSRELFLAMGRFVDSLDGRYITAEDVNIGIADLEVVRESTRYVTGLSRQSGSSGNPSPYTAHGVYLGIRYCIERVTGSADMAGRRVGILGVGAVGSALAHKLRESGAEVIAADLDETRVSRLVDECGVQAASEPDVLALDCDVFAPCALGGILNDDTIPKLGCKIVAGAANNVLLEPRHGLMLRERGILYAPDYVINAGGIINVSVELLPGGYDEQVSLNRIERIPAALAEIFDLAQERGICTSEAADIRAEQILAEGRARKGA